jgi:hypothetical protein
MSNGKNKVKPQVWIALAIVLLILFSLIASWWKEHSAIGWTIVILLVIGLGFGLYRYSSFRRFFVSKAKDTAKNIIYEEEVPQREPVPTNIRKTINSRSGYRCENPDCKASVAPHLHHIDNDYNNNSPKNIIALCPNCHALAHKDMMTNSQLRNWVQRSWESYKRA